MIIGVDAACLGISDERLKVGVYQAAKNFLEALKKIDAKNTYLLYSFNPIDKKLLTSFGKNAKNIIVRPARGWLKIWLPLRIAKDRVDIFLALSQSAPQRYFFSPQYKTVALIHDVMFGTFPEMYADAHRLFDNTKYLLEDASSIVAVSETTKKDIQKMFEVDAPITVAYEGIPESITVKHTKSNLQSPKSRYFLSVGALKKSKNFPRLLEAFEKFCNHTQFPYELYIAGSDRWKDPKIEQVLSRLSPALQKRVHIQGFVSDTALATLYAHADVFVSPSVYEGFGLPFVEAMHYGLPLIAGNAGASTEVVGNAGILVHADSAEKIYLAMRKIVEDNDLRARLSKNARIRAKLFSWGSFTKTIYSIIARYEN